MSRAASAETTVSAVPVRRLAVAAQGYAGRYRRAGADDVETAIRRLSCVQLDSISVVDRSDRLTLTSRVGDYPRDTVSRLLSAGRIFEYWAHEACLLPIEDWPLFGPSRRNGGRRRDREGERTPPPPPGEGLAQIRERGAPGPR